MPRWQTPVVNEIELPPPKPRRWPLVLASLVLLVACATWLFRERLFPPPPFVPKSNVAAVKSDVTQRGDSLDVVVSWTLADARLGEMVDSVRLEVDLASSDTSSVAMLPSSRRADTVHFGVPPTGQATGGTSCVSTLYLGRLSHERCTPWQFVRPSANVVSPDTTTLDTTARKSGRPQRPAEVPRIARIVIHPEGQQVDPDLGGHCAEWQRRHPQESVWIDVNRTAVPDCTGPNGKPTVAQFCAFAVLADGSRVKTANSAKNRYCEELFQEWIRQRVT
jgi:hypothetical protein